MHRIKITNQFTAMEKIEQLSGNESLKLIETMIQRAKTRATGDGTYFLLWGYLVFTAALIHLAGIRMGHEEAGGFAWGILMGFGGVYSAWKAYSEERRQKSSSYIDFFMKYLWIAFGAAIGLILLICLMKAPAVTYPMILVLYGIGTFVSGGALEFKPLIWGGIFCWILALVAAMVSFENQLIVLAVAVVGSYIIPGHLLQNLLNREKI